VALLRQRHDEDMEAWRTAMESRSANAAPSPSDGEEDDAEAAQGTEPPKDGPVLGLPSEYSSADRRRYGLQTMAAIEVLLRKRLAFDLIAEIRQKAVEQALARAKSHTEAGSSQTVTRAKGVLAARERAMMEVVDIYNRNWDAMVALGEEEGVLKRIRKSRGDLRHDATTKSRKRQAAQVEEGWIWNVGRGSMRQAGLPESAWEGGEDMGKGLFSATTRKRSCTRISDLRIRWLRAREEKTRLEEEIAKKHEEFRNTIRSHRAEETARVQLAEAEVDSPGRRAFWHAQAREHRLMAEYAEQKYAPHRRAGPIRLYRWPPQPSVIKVCFSLRCVQEANALDVVDQMAGPFEDTVDFDTARTVWIGSDGRIMTSDGKGGEVCVRDLPEFAPGDPPGDDRDDSAPVEGAATASV
jgi:hypothetical protein